MERSSAPRKTVSNLPGSVHQQLNMYALAAGAAGVGVLALAQPAAAKIVYTSAHVVIGAGGVKSYNLDLNNDGIADVTIRETAHFYPCQGQHGVQWSFFETATAGNGVEGAPPMPLRAGAPIGGRQHFYAGQGLLATSVIGFNGATCQHKGAWWAVTDRYLGVKFKIHKKTHYGWARLSFSRRNATLTGYAYENIAGKSIKAGQTHGKVDDPTDENFGPGASLTSPIPDTPQPASLGMLALGAPGVPLWRRKEWTAEGDLKGALL